MLVVFRTNDEGLDSEVKSLAGVAEIRFRWTGDGTVLEAIVSLSRAPWSQMYSTYAWLEKGESAEASDPLCDSGDVSTTGLQGLKRRHLSAFRVSSVRKDRGSFTCSWPVACKGDNSCTHSDRQCL